MEGKSRAGSACRGGLTSRYSRSASNHQVWTTIIEFPYSVFPISDFARNEGKRQSTQYLPELTVLNSTYILPTLSIGISSQETFWSTLTAS
jgi:hypothetical protein